MINTNKVLVSLLLIMTFISTSFFATAQNKNKVQFAFSVVPFNDSIQNLTIKAVIPQGLQLFSAKKHGKNPYFDSLRSWTPRPAGTPPRVRKRRCRRSANR